MGEAEWGSDRLKTATKEVRFHVDGSNSLETQTFENDCSCDLSPNALSFKKIKGGGH